MRDWGYPQWWDGDAITAEEIVERLRRVLERTEEYPSAPPPVERKFKEIWVTTVLYKSTWDRLSEKDKAENYRFLYETIIEEVEEQLFPSLNSETVVRTKAVVVEKRDWVLVNRDEVRNEDEIIQRWWEGLTEEQRRDIAVLSFFVHELWGIPPIGDGTARGCSSYIIAIVHPRAAWSAFRLLVEKPSERENLLKQLYENNPTLISSTR